MRVEREGFVVEGVDGEVFAVPGITPFVVVLILLVSLAEGMLAVGACLPCIHTPTARSRYSRNPPVRNDWRP